MRTDGRTLFFSCLNEIVLFQQIFENPQKPNFMKIRPLRVELFHTDGRYSFPVLMKLYCFNRFSKNPRKPNFMKIRPVGVELFHTDGRTLFFSCLNEIVLFQQIFEKS